MESLPIVIEAANSLRFILPKEVQPINNILLYIVYNNNYPIPKQLYKYISIKYGYDIFERLEFIGDSVLELIVRFELFNQYQLYKVNILSHIKEAIVNNETLSCLSKKLGICSNKKALCSTKDTSCRYINKLCADQFEALIGAIYLYLSDIDFPLPIKFIHKWLDSIFDLDLIIEDIISRSKTGTPFSSCVNKRYLEKLPPPESYRYTTGEERFSRLEKIENAENLI